ncbi:hypothetical protein PENSUB_6745 [Penicillium subrubescens]|uniref:Uncharacterized protein n=1 Tax=Penicillium subrubescens TaxID=1316194 RepID=A0A1Q5TXR0_9EURO|nr:hypothetical protein PENSUB_6745 [Penicillium subrubescens]
MPEQDRQVKQREQWCDQCDPDWAAAESVIDSSDEDSNAEMQEVERSSPNSPSAHEVPVEAQHRYHHTNPVIAMSTTAALQSDSGLLSSPSR